MVHEMAKERVHGEHQEGALQLINGILGTNCASLLINYWAYMSYFCNDLGWIDVVSNDFGIFQGDNITIYYRVFFFFYVGRSARRLPFYNGRSILL